VYIINGTSYNQYVSEIYKFDLNSLLSINEYNNLNIRVYPNPTTDYLNIKISGSTSFNVNIYDLNGKLLKSEKNNTSIKIQELTNGLYVLEIVDFENDNIIIKKIIKE